MNRRLFRPRYLTIVLLLTFGIVIVSQAQAIVGHIQQTWTAPSVELQRMRPGPEADPHLRHNPGGYDYELEAPPIDLP